MKSKLGIIYLRIGVDIVKTTIKPDGYNIYEGGIVRWKGVKYIVVGRENVKDGWVLNVEVR